MHDYKQILQNIVLTLSCFLILPCLCGPGFAPPPPAPYPSSTPAFVSAIPTTPSIINNSSTLDIQISFNDKDHIETLSRSGTIAIPANCWIMYYSPDLKKSIKSLSITPGKSYKINPNEDVMKVTIEML